MKEKKGTNSVTNPVIYNSVLLARCTNAKLVGIIDQYLIELKAHFVRGKPSLIPLGWPRIQDQICQGLRGKSNIVLLKEHSNKMTPTDILLSS